MTSARTAVRVRRARSDPSVRAYEHALRRAGLNRRAGETPRELLRRARGEDLRADRLSALESATLRHERERYAA